MRITILTLGSRGDVQPYVALGKGLGAAGHSVSLATHGLFSGLVTGAGLEFRTVAGDPRALTASEAGRRAWHSRSQIRFVRRAVSLWSPEYDAIAYDASEACTDAEVIIASLPAIFLGYSLAESRRIPCIQASYSPAAATGEFPAFLVPELRAGPLQVRRTYNLASHALASLIAWRAFRKPVDRWRKTRLGLPPIRPVSMFTALRRGVSPSLYGYSSLVVPRPADWPPFIHVTGYWFLDSPAEWRPDPALADFLGGGDPPIYVGFGSPGAAADAPRLLSILRAALRRSGRRAVLVRGWTELSAAGSDDLIHLIDDVPHDWLFPRVAAVVHHAGAGTTGAGLRAGIPAVPVPFAIDQPFWARRVWRLGVGTRPIPRRKLSVPALAGAIDQATGDPAMRARAAVLGTKIRAENGVERAVEAFDCALERWTGW